MNACIEDSIKIEIHERSLVSGELGSAILILEDEEGHYEPIGIASSLDEACELAVGDLNVRSLHRDDLCPHRYALFVRGTRGKYQLAASLKPQHNWTVSEQEK
jgi:hypothetical protein